MFIRKKKNQSGKISIQVIDKSSGKYKVAYTAGSSTDKQEIYKLISIAQEWIRKKQKVMEFDFSDQIHSINQFLNNIHSLNRIGYDLLLGRIFDEIGFNQIRDELFKELVIARIAFPKSKLKTAEFLYRYKQIDYHQDQIYRYLDKLHSSQKELIQTISFKHTQAILGSDVNVVFYDVTTIYFEIDKEDELRKTGFSKEGKHQNPQIVLGLLVSKKGYPLAYDVFEGNKFEGHTMLPVLEGFKKKYKLKQLVIIADSGLLSKSNIEELQTKKYEFIIGARIKNETKKIQQKILTLKLENGKSEIIKKGDLKLVISYSEQRAKKDKYNREKGLRRLEKLIQTGKLTKSSINNRGYNKFLKLEGEIKVAIDQQKLASDSKWDGLKGYITNAKLNKNQIIENYRHLWHIEKAFRIAKSDLKVRPIYHRLQKRIEAHICISFVAYKVYKELERQLELRKAEISPNKAIEIAESIMEIAVTTPDKTKRISRILYLTEEHKMLAEIMNF